MGLASSASNQMEMLIPINVGFNDRFSLCLSNQSICLNITQVTKADDIANGEFVCKLIDWRAETWKRGFQIKVLYPAKIVKFEDEYIVGANQSATLNCTAEGNPPPTYTWTPCGSRKFCGKNSIDLLNVCNDVSYTCKVANRLGNDSKTANVYIGGKLINTTITLKGEPCEDGLSNKSSVEETFKEQLIAAFADKYGYEEVQSMSVRCDNKTVDLALKFNSTTKGKNVITTLINATLEQGGKLGEFSVSAIKLKTCPKNVPVTSPPEYAVRITDEMATDEMSTPPPGRSSEGMDWWKILLIAFVVAICFGFVVEILFRYFCAKSKGSKKVHPDGGQDLEMSEGRLRNGSSPPVQPHPEKCSGRLNHEEKEGTAELSELPGREKKATLPPVTGTNTVYVEVN